ncbi:MAG TPA: glycosyltransferase [Bacteroidales bacterium]|nr:glycosyltransferase [Bacteroidales bacterium]HPT03435.1 glycosyltransferase [Bacteroidales bacterium]
MIFEYYSQNPVFFWLLCLLAFTVVIQLVYYWGFFAKVAYFRHKNDFTRKDEPVSVIICARDEYYNLKENLPLFLQQDYSNYEVVVVNHGSEDETQYLLEDFSREYPHLKIVNLPDDLNFFTGKKFPLSIGIKSAQNDICLFTDADCAPRGTDWLRKMASNFTFGTEIVLGYGAYQREKSLLNLLIRFDTLRIAMQYMGFALAGIPYMGVGRNLAYRKSLFYRHGGFISHYRIRTGDDDLFINKAANRKNTRVEFRKESHTLSKPKHTLRQWIRQKRRHLTSGGHYKQIHRFLLGLNGISQFLFYALIVFLLVEWYQPYIVLGLAALRLLTQLIVIKRIMRRFAEKGFLLLVPFFELFLLILTPVLVMTNSFYKPPRWK